MPHTVPALLIERNTLPTVILAAPACELAPRSISSDHFGSKSRGGSAKQRLNRAVNDKIGIELGVRFVNRPVSASGTNVWITLPFPAVAALAGLPYLFTIAETPTGFAASLFCSALFCIAFWHREGEQTHRGPPDRFRHWELEMFLNRVPRIIVHKKRLRGAK